jgi:hypothetical protein
MKHQILISATNLKKYTAAMKWVNKDLYWMIHIIQKVHKVNS